MSDQQDIATTKPVEEVTPPVQAQTNETPVETAQVPKEAETIETPAAQTVDPAESAEKTVGQEEQKQQEAPQKATEPAVEEKVKEGTPIRKTDTPPLQLDDSLVRETESLNTSTEKKAAYQSLPVEKKIAVQMNQIPETLEPEETARGEKPQSANGDGINHQLETAKFAQENADDTKNPLGQTSPRQNFQNVMSTEEQLQFAPPEIQIDNSSIENFVQVEPVSIKKELWLRLIKTGVLSLQPLEDKAAIEANSELTHMLTKSQTGRYLNGQLFGRYLVFLKKHMKHKWNQIWSIKVAMIKTLQSGMSDTIISENWNIITAELDKIAITVTEEKMAALQKGQKEQVDVIFNRIERYSKIITDPDFLKYDKLDEKSKYDAGMDDTTVYNMEVMSDANLSDLISLRQNTYRSNAKEPSSLNKMLARGSTKKSSNKYMMPPGINKPPHKSSTMLANDLRVRGQSSDILGMSQDYQDDSNILNAQSPAPSSSKFIKLAEEYKGEAFNMISPQNATEDLATDPDMINSKEQEQSNMVTIVEQQDQTPKTSITVKEPKFVKDGVDILALDSSKAIGECDSSLELILVTLSKSFNMSPKQAAALLTNNNQYLITACIKGVKGGKYEPLLQWYDLLISNCETLAELLHCEVQQLPQSAPQTFVKVMAAIGCGFFSYNNELVYMTFALFTQLFERFQTDGQDAVQQQALKWFLSAAPSMQTDEITAQSLLSEEKNNQQELINAGGLKLSLYAVRKHQETARHAMIMYNVLCQAEDQMFMIYATEIQSHTKSSLDYMELVGEFLPIMYELWPEKAIDSGLVDFWLDLCSREAENDFKVQNKEKVLAISLLAEIWILFTDYVDDKEEVTNTLIFVFKRTVSERTKSIRLISIAYLFKILEKLIDLKKKAALTLYRALIYSLVEGPFDPTIRELYYANFIDLFRVNPKMPIEWLVEPLLKQIQVQIGVTFALKIFDFSFMMSLMDLPKFKEDHAASMFALFAQVSLDDTSYASAAHQVMLATLQKHCKSEIDNEQIPLLEKAQEHVRLLFDILLDLEPISRSAAFNQLKRQQRQNAQKIRQGINIGGIRQSHAQLALTNTPGSTGGKPPLKARELLSGTKTNNGGSLTSLGGLNKTNHTKDMMRRHKKSLAIDFLLKMQALDVARINSVFLKELLFDKMKEFKGTYGYFNKGHVELLKIYGEPESLIMEHELDPQILEQQELERQLATENNNGQTLAKKRASPFVQKTIKARKDTPSRGNSQNRPVQKEENDETKELTSTALVPFKEPSSSQNRTKSIGKARAIQEIQKIKQIKIEREQKKEAEQEQLRLASAKRRRRVKIEIEKMREKNGITSKPRQTYKDGLQQTGEQGNRTLKSKQVTFVDLDQEEDRDRETVTEFMKKYQKLWHNIFQKYQNTGHNARALVAPTFTSKNQSLNFAEITKLLKDHGTYPQLINKEELSQMVRAINQRSKVDNLQALTYQDYQTFIVQLGIHCFSRPPQDLSSQPMVKSLEALVATFTEETKKRKLSTLLYENPDAVVANAEDKEKLRQLNETVKQNPNQPMPKDFLRVKERVPVYDYTIPKDAVQFIGEAKATSVELLDELVSKLFDFHVIEPIVSMKEEYRVKLSMQRSLQRDGAKALSIIRKHEQKRGSVDNLGSRNKNRSNKPKIGSVSKNGKLTLDDLPPYYKKVVSKQPRAKRAIYEDVSFILENMVRQVTGEGELKPSEDYISRDSVSSEASRRLSQPQSRDDIKNAARSLPPLQEDIDGIKFEQIKDRQEEILREEKRQKEKKRRERQRKLKSDLGKLKEERKVKAEEEAIRLLEENKKKKEDDKIKEERRQKIRDEAKIEITDAKDNKENAKEEVYDPEVEREKEIQKKREKKAFFLKQQEKLNNQFKSMSDQRKATDLQEQQKVAQDKKKKILLKKKIDQQNEQGQGNRERNLASDISQFLSQAEVSQLFNDHEKALLKYFKYYCRQNRVELGQDLQYRLEHLDYNSFNKFGIMSKIVPVLISTEQLKSNFRNAVKQSQLNNADLQNVTEDSQQRAGSTLDSSSPQQIDFESFKKTLVRIALQGQELLGGQSEEQRQRRAEADEKRRLAIQHKKELIKNRQEQRIRLESETLSELKKEYSQKQKQIQSVTSRSPAKKMDKIQSQGDLIGGEQASETIVNEEEFQRWMKQQDAIGNGLNQRVTEKMNRASKPKQAADDVSADSPSKLQNIADGQESAEDLKSGDAPLLRAKQTQAQRNISQRDNGPAEVEFDISLISVDTIKALFDFMSIESGDEGERNIDNVLSAQANQVGRGRDGASKINQLKRGLSKEPASSNAQEQQRN